MEKKQHSAKFLRKRKFMMVIPLLVIPFLTMAFWALGGGADKEDKMVKAKVGLNPNLPDANLKDDKDVNKLSFYESAQRDSIKLKEAMKADPYYRNSLESFVDPGSYNDAGNSYSDKNVYANTGKVYEKISQINEALNQPVYTKQSSGSINNDVNRLEDMMTLMNQPGDDDPEMKQINTALDKILDVQHPERVRQKIKENSEKQRSRVFAVNAGGTTVTLLKRDDTIVRKVRNGFFNDQSSSLALNAPNSIPAVVHESQTLTAGATVKLRLISDVFIQGIAISKGTFVFGTASLQEERLLITITHVRFQNNLLPVSLSVHDLDGLAGIHIPGSINRDVAKQSAEQSMQSVELMTLDPSLQAQAAAAGVNAAKSLLSKKVKLTKVTVKAGYQVLLKDNNQQNF